MLQGQFRSPYSNSPIAEPEPSFGRRFYSPFGGGGIPEPEPTSFRLQPQPEPSSYRIQPQPEPFLFLNDPDPEPEPEPQTRTFGSEFAQINPTQNIINPKPTLNTLPISAEPLPDIQEIPPKILPRLQPELRSLESEAEAG